MIWRAAVGVVLAGLILEGPQAQVSFERLTSAADEAQNWLTYSGNYFSDRYSRLHQITPANVARLERQWVFQTGAFGLSWETTPLVVDGVMYLTQRPNDVVAIDRTSGTELLDVEVADMRLAYAFTLAPLAVDGKVIVGTSGGDRGVRGFIAAFDAGTGEEVWRFYTVPGPGEPGHETWEPVLQTRRPTATQRRGNMAVGRSG